ncbi:MAG: hypothetical protein GX595_16620 [Lentisphaerae bacterium]|nr:hypothetical protein [Lentisphaerota bacterium]
MTIDSSTYTTTGGKTYTRHLLRESYRRGAKAMKRTLANLSHAQETARTALDSPQAEGPW